MDAHALVEAALEPLWQGDWAAHLRWIAPTVTFAHGHAGWPPRPSLWQRLRGTDHAVGAGHGAYTAAMQPIAEAIGRAPEHYRRFRLGSAPPSDPSIGLWEGQLVIIGVDLAARWPMSRQWHYHPRVQLSAQQIVGVNLYDEPY
jgi:hypothetical protein